MTTRFIEASACGVTFRLGEGGVTNIAIVPVESLCAVQPSARWRSGEVVLAVTFTFQALPDVPVVVAVAMDEVTTLTTGVVQ